MLKDLYGDNEILLSKVLKDRRNEVFLCTKFGFIQGPNGISGISGTPEYVRQACETSLKRLGIDCIDLYYQHRVDVNT
jgi:aryl-alcohol dehydrogenase-like predicted oxidoreductase